jgi:hypothetical protein
MQIQIQEAWVGLRVYTSNKFPGEVDVSTLSLSLQVIQKWSAG